MTERDRFTAPGAHIWTEQERLLIRFQAGCWRFWTGIWIAIWQEGSR